MKKFDIVIVGAGVMGAAAAYELALEGTRVALIDQSTLPNPRAASIDHSKVFRFAYPEVFYVELAADALPRWRDIESNCSTRILTPTGALLLGRNDTSFELDSYNAMHSLGVKAEKLDCSEVVARFPQFNRNAFDFGVYDPFGAILHAETAVTNLIALARSHGVEIIESERVDRITNFSSTVVITTERDTRFECERAMISAGPWSRGLLSFLRSELATTRQEIVYFEPLNSRAGFEPHSFPIFLELKTGFYGFPIHHKGAMKIANHHKGSIIDPEDREIPVDERFVESCRGFFSEFIPALADARVIETRVCVYNNTPDDDFIIDWHPQFDRVLVVTGFSGHGFKFGPTIGRIAADLLVKQTTRFNIDRFSLARFNKT